MEDDLSLCFWKKIEKKYTSLKCVLLKPWHRAKDMLLIVFLIEFHCVDTPLCFAVWWFAQLWNASDFYSWSTVWVPKGSVRSRWHYSRNITTLREYFSAPPHLLPTNDNLAPHSFLDFLFLLTPFRLYFSLSWLYLLTSI